MTTGGGVSFSLRNVGGRSILRSSRGTVEVLGISAARAIDRGLAARRSISYHCLSCRALPMRRSSAPSLDTCANGAVPQSPRRNSTPGHLHGEAGDAQAGEVDSNHVKALEHTKEKIQEQICEAENRLLEQATISDEAKAVVHVVLTEWLVRAMCNEADGLSESSRLCSKEALRLQWTVAEMKLATSRKAHAVAMKDNALEVEAKVTTKLQERARALSSGAGDALAEADLKVAELTAELSGLKMSLEGQQQALSMTKGVLRAAEASAISWESQATEQKVLTTAHEAELERCKQVLDGASSDLGDKIKNKTSLDQTNTTLEQKVGEFVDRTRQLHGNVEQARGELKQALAGLNVASDENASLTEQVHQLVEQSKDSGALREERDRCKQALDEALAQLDTGARTNDSLKETNATLEQKVGEFVDRTRQLHGDVDEARGDLKQALANLGIVSDENASLTDQIHQLAELSKDSESLLKERDAFKEKGAMLQTALERVDGQLRDVREELERERRDGASKEEELRAEAQRERELLEGELDKARSLEAGGQRAVDAEKEKVAQLNGEKVALEKLVCTLRKDAEALKAKLAKAEAIAGTGGAELEKARGQMAEMQRLIDQAMATLEKGFASLNLGRPKKAGDSLRVRVDVLVEQCEKLVAQCESMRAAADKAFAELNIQVREKDTLAEKIKSIVDECERRRAESARLQQQVDELNNQIHLMGDANEQVKYWKDSFERSNAEVKQCIAKVAAANGGLTTRTKDDPLSAHVDRLLRQEEETRLKFDTLGRDLEEALKKLASTDGNNQAAIDHLKQTARSERDHLVQAALESMSHLRTHLTSTLAGLRALATDTLKVEVNTHDRSQPERPVHLNCFPERPLKLSPRHTKAAWSIAPADVYFMPRPPVHIESQRTARQGFLEEPGAQVDASPLSARARLQSSEWTVLARGVLRGPKRQVADDSSVLPAIGRADASAGRSASTPSTRSGAGRRLPPSSNIQQMNTDLTV